MNPKLPSHLSANLPSWSLMHDTLRRYKDAQFLISTHSPVLLGYPEAQILSFDGSHLHEIRLIKAQPLCRSCAAFSTTATASFRNYSPTHRLSSIKEQS